MSTKDARLQAALARCCALAEQMNLSDVLSTLRALPAQNDMWARSVVIDARKHAVAARAEDLKIALESLIDAYDDRIYFPNDKKDPRRVTRALRNAGRLPSEHHAV